MSRNFKGWTLADLDKMSHKRKTIAIDCMELQANRKEQSKPSKYRNKKVVVDGIKFDSIKEGDRYLVLKDLSKNGVISDLKLQVVYELNKGGTFSYKYKADFVYERDGQTIVEDVKGAKTVVFRKKCKLMKKVHGITILIT